MRLAAAIAVLTVSATADAHLDREIIRRAIHKARPKVIACYERALKKEPALEGKVSVRFTIQRDGTTSDAVATGMPAINSCIERVMLGIVFPKLPGPVFVAYPFHFHPVPD